MVFHFIVITHSATVNDAHKHTYLKTIFRMHVFARQKWIENEEKLNMTEPSLMKTKTFDEEKKKMHTTTKTQRENEENERRKLSYFTFLCSFRFHFFGKHTIPCDIIKYSLETLI